MGKNLSMQIRALKPGVIVKNTMVANELDAREGNGALTAPPRVFFNAT
jgi:hypothetical protein